ncbi:Hsp33 family molecular chaperone HslO [Rubrimonas cliftonensis]|uniref:Molecular chaperone Hsp33 n=1 Tax=Rubrimonas cliftonensis TaxID=89524 RepID=A0A1H3VY84_9RHOB|nr:Hsp33 family molecular chaperone HslO [Rubrimonas cliftonensis]SDZ79018.1 molecular chaperone Hsp33 [Rubrimonas cliftonensis]
MDDDIRQAPQAAPNGDDTVLPFELERADVRGRVARLDTALEAILAQHAYPDAVSALAAEAALLTALIGQTLKLRWRLSLQVRSEGAVRLIATDYFGPSESGEPARIRAYAGFDAERVAAASTDAKDFGADPFALLGPGLFAMTIDQGPDMRPYQGMTPLAGGSLAACAETYFAQSEQIATRFHLSAALSAAPGEAARWRGGGVMLQQLPKASPHAAPAEPSAEDGLMRAEDVAAMGDGAEAWRRVNILLDTAEAHELLGPVVGAERLLLRLFHEERPRVWPAQPVAFGCTCSRERVEAAMAQYSARDIETMTTPEGKVTADCQFCGARYAFDPGSLGFESGAEGPGAPTS